MIPSRSAQGHTSTASTFSAFMPALATTAPAMICRLRERDTLLSFARSRALEVPAAGQWNAMLHTVHDHDDWNAGARGETPMQRADRAYGEILQEVRVAQTGVQILFAFLLALAFQARFAAITDFQRGVYVVTLMLCAAATALLIAPAAIHRVI